MGSRKNAKKSAIGRDDSRKNSKKLPTGARGSKKDRNNAKKPAGDESKEDNTNFFAGANRNQTSGASIDKAIELLGAIERLSGDQLELAKTIYAVSTTSTTSSKKRRRRKIKRSKGQSANVHKEDGNIGLDAHDWSEQELTHLHNLVAHNFDTLGTKKAFLKAARVAISKGLVDKRRTVEVVAAKLREIYDSMKRKKESPLDEGKPSRDENEDDGGGKGTMAAGVLSTFANALQEALPMVKGVMPGAATGNNDKKKGGPLRFGTSIGAPMSAQKYQHKKIDSRKLSPCAFESDEL